MTSFISFLLISLLFLTSALAMPLDKRDVVDPPVTNPNASTKWTVGSTQLVVWDTSQLPPYNQITNQVGTIVLGFLNSKGENLMLDHPLAKGFNITQGSIQVVVPDVPARTNYIVVLMGDSGNASPMFTIVSDAPSLIGNSIPPAQTPSSGSAATTSTTKPMTSSSSSSSSSSSPYQRPSGVDTATPTTSSGSGSLPSSSGSVATTLTPSSSSSLTTFTTTTSSAAVQATSSKSSGAIPLHRAGATCFGAVLILASLLL